MNSNILNNLTVYKQMNSNSFENKVIYKIFT